MDIGSILEVNGWHLLMAFSQRVKGKGEPCDLGIKLNRGACDGMGDAGSKGAGKGDFRLEPVGTAGGCLKRCHCACALGFGLPTLSPILPGTNLPSLGAWSFFHQAWALGF